MKRFLFSLVAISAIIASCAKEELKPEAPEVIGGTYSFKALISDATKTSINDDGTMAWITGDQISVYDGAFETFTLKGEASGAEATFTGELTDPSAVALAVCPAGIGSKVADEMLTLNLPASYEYDGQSTHAPMIATSFAVNDKEATIKFKHIGGLFKVTYNNVPEDAATFCFEATKQIAGSFMIDYVNNPVLEVADEESETNNVVSYTINPDDDHSSMSFYVPVPVGTFGFNISLKDEGGNKIAKSSKKKNEIEIVRGDYVAIPAINMPKKWVEEFNSSSNNTNHSKYGSGLGFTSTEVTKQFDYTWTADGKVYLFVGGVRLGTSSDAGTISSEGIIGDITDGGTFTVKVYGAAWNTDSGNISVTYNGKTFAVAPANAAITNTGTTASDEYDSDDFTESTDFVFMKSAGSDVLSVTTTSGRIFIDKIEIVEGGDLPESFSVSPTSLTPAWDDTEATFNITAGDKVEWTISAVEGLSFNQNSGSGNATITITFAQNEAEQQLQKEILVSTEYPNVEEENSYTINFTQAGKPTREMDGEGTVENPYSVADALYLYSNLPGGESTTEYYVKGTVRSVGSSPSSGKLSYYIGTSNENEIQVYNGKDLGNVNFSAATDIAVGDEVVVYGKIYNYVNAQSVSKAEINDGNYLYSINGRTSIITGIAVNGQKTSFAQNDPWEFGGTVTASYRGKEAADVTSTATFKVNGSDPSTATIGKGFMVTVTYSENEVEKTTTYTYDVYDPTAVTLIKVESVDDFTAGMYVIMSYNQAYYVPNAAATNAGPTVTAVTKTGDEINITPAMVWNATAATGGLEFTSLSVPGSKLWGATSNDGVRVNTSSTIKNSSSIWKPEIVGTYGMVAYAGASGSDKYYLATNSNKDWRNYRYANSIFGGQNANLPANFYKLLNWTLPKHTLTITTPSNGTITAKVGEEPVSSGSEIEEGKTVTITAAPEDNYIFSGWTVEGATVEDATATTTTFVVGQSNITVSAAFKSADIEYDVNVATGITGGTVEVDKAKAKAGEEVTITATPTGTNVLRTLTVKGDTSGEEVTVTDKKFTMPAEDVTVNATFGAPIAKITITASSVTNFDSSYAEYNWTADGVSGTMYAYRGGSSGAYNMQFNSTPQVHNTTAIPGYIRSIKITKASTGSERSWSVYVGTSEIKTTTDGTKMGDSQTIGTSGYTWEVTGNYSYFYLTKGSKSTNIESIVITYEPNGDMPSPTKLSTPTDLTWTEGTKTLSWTNTNTSNGTYGTNYKYQYRIGSDGSWTDATSATTAVLTITETKTVYVKAVAVNTTNYSDSDETTGTSCTISSSPSGELTNGKSYSYTIESKVFDGNNQSKTLGGMDWKFTTDNAGYYSYDSGVGLHLGSGSKAISYAQFELDYDKYCDSGTAKKVNTVKVTCRSAGTSPTVSVTVGGEAVESAKTINNTMAEYTFTASKSLSGSIVINISQTSGTKAIYIQKVSIN